ncbi:G-type lectin S-receptor-like serine/threonine-protein kinase At1g61490 [Carex rostrata]
MLEIQLSSWNITGIDPSPGQYVRKVDPSRRYELVTFMGSDVIYRSGPWTGMRWNGFPKMTNELVRFNVSKSGENGAFFWYEPLDSSVLWRLVLDSNNGTTYRYYLNNSEWIEFWKAPDDTTPRYAFCGPYGIYSDGTCKCCLDSFFHHKNEKDWKNRIYSGGCERVAPLNNDTTDHGFQSLDNVKLPDTLNAISDERKNESECKSWCQKNSSCMAYAHIGWQGCLAWFGDITDMIQFHEGGDTLYISVASKSDASKSESNKINVLFAVLLSIAAVMVLLSLAVVFLFWKTRRWPFKRTSQVVLGNNPSNGREDVQIFEIFDFTRIIASTDNFSHTIGEGQLGPVYKGILENGEEIAVKRVSRSAHNGNEQLKNELNLLARLKHKNLVKLLGFCIQREEIILCFEFMTNSSLDQVLYGTRMLQVQLNWEQRSRLIQGISSGLLYLHEDIGDTVIHRDVKPANILLDRNMVPKISDFGISRLFEEDRTFFTISTIGGTRGYMAPELQSGMLSAKADVYSFGMVVLEIISGKRNTSSPTGLVSLVLQYLNEGRILDLKDERLREPCSDVEIKRSIHIALQCLLEDPNLRPSMREINHWLTCQSTHPLPLPDQASCWGNIVIGRSTVVNSSALLPTEYFESPAQVNMRHA